MQFLTSLRLVLGLICSDVELKPQRGGDSHKQAKWICAAVKDGFWGLLTRVAKSQVFVWERAYNSSL